MFAEYESDFNFSFSLVIFVFSFIDRFNKFLVELSENALTCRIDDLDPVQCLVLVPVSQ